MIRGVHKMPERLLLLLDTERVVDVAEPGPATAKIDA
jgi:hypothetical protein